MDEAQRLSILTAEIYDAALDPGLWTHVLECSAKFVGGVASALFTKDLVRKHHNTIFSWGYDPYYTQIYLEKYGKLDPFATAQLFSEIGTPISGADIFSHREHRKSVFYKEWVKPQRWIDAIAATLQRSATSYAAFSVIRHEDNGVIDEKARRRMKLIVPHVRRAVLIGKIVDIQEVRAEAFANTLDGLAAAIFLLDTGGHIVHTNAAGQRLLAGTAMRHAAGKLTPTDPVAERALEGALLNTQSREAGLGSVDFSLFSEEGEPYVAHVLPLTSGARHHTGLAYSAVAAVFVHKVAIELPHPLESIAGRFKLSPAEMRVMMMIVEVGGVPDIARVLGVSETTVKTHLHRIFAKTNTRRQADLVKLIAGYIGPLSHQKLL